MSFFYIEQYVFNIPSKTVIVFGTIKINSFDNQLCLTSSIKLNLVFNNDISKLLILQPESVSLILNLICPNEQTIGGSIEYNTEQFLNVNSDNPLISQLIPITNINDLPPNITIRLPTQKIIRSRAIELSYSKCLDYFQCQDYILELTFPEMVFTSQFNFTIEFKTLDQSSDMCNLSQIIKNNCGKNCQSNVNFPELNMNKIALGNPITLKCNQTIICFYPWNKIKTDKGWKLVNKINTPDSLIEHSSQKCYSVKQVYRLPINSIIKFVTFPINCFGDNLPFKTCYLTPEHMVKTPFGCLNAQQCYEQMSNSHGIRIDYLFTDYIYAFEVNSQVSDIYVEYEGLLARVWSLNEKNQLKQQLEIYKRK